jgi:predicted DNA-binding transcriptional regulator AlpA
MTTETTATPPGRTLTGLADLPERALLDETALAAALACSKRTVRQMVARHELPPPIPLAGRSTWVAGRVLAWIEAAAEGAQQAAAAAAERFRAGA